jgi:peptidoglycan/LPS O-acetylase OafA/YrhL
MILDTSPVTTPHRAARHQAPARVRPEGVRFRRDIEGLRAVAVIAVVLGHAGVPFMHGGYIGVDVFFVISGFLITSYLVDEIARSGRLSIVSFYARRALRLLPAAALVVAATLLMTWLWLPTLRFRSVGLDALTATVYGLNYRLAGLGTDYFATDAAPSPLQHFWSLAVEEQFYLVWPVLLAATAVWFRRRPRWWPAAVAIGVLAVASFVVGVVQTASSAPWAYFGTPARAWELAVGAGLALAAHRLAGLPRRVGTVLAWSGLAAVTASVFLYTETTPFPGVAALLPVLGTAAVVAAGCGRAEGGAFRLLNAGFCQGIGRLSYSWYLWHWPVLVIAPIAFDLELRTGQGLVLAVWSLVLAALTYVIVEDPVRTGRWLRTRPWRGVTFGAGLSASLAAVVAAAVFLAVPGNLGTGTAVDTERALASSTAATASLSGLILASANSHELPANLTPPLPAAADDRPLMYADGCDMGFRGERIDTICSYGDEASPVTVVLFGDSHAGHWFPTLNEIARQRGWRLLVLTKSACSAASTLIYLPALRREYTECVTWRRNAMTRIREIRPALVVMSSNGGGGLPLGATGDADQAWTTAWLESVRQLRSEATRLVLISDTPWPAGNVPDCLSDHPHDVHRCDRPVSRAVSVPRRRAMVAAAVAREGVLVVDPLPWFCTTETCPVVVGNTLVYKDGSHMTTAYAEALVPVLRERLPDAGTG